jgi:hypothetical protein
MKALVPTDYAAAPIILPTCLAAGPEAFDTP